MQTGSVQCAVKSQDANWQCAMCSQESRKATDGIIISTAYPATVDEWSRVLIQLEQWHGRSMAYRKQLSYKQIAAVSAMLHLHV